MCCRDCVGALPRLVSYMQNNPLHHSLGPIAPWRRHLAFVLLQHLAAHRRVATIRRDSSSPARLRRLVAIQLKFAKPDATLVRCFVSRPEWARSSPLQPEPHR